MNIPVPTSNRQALLLAAVMLVVFPTILMAFPGLEILQRPVHFLPLHTFLELFAIAVAVLVTGIGWNATHGNHAGHMTVLGAGFLAVGLLDVGHTLSYVGMPDLVTPSGVEKGIWFWMAARMVSAITLLAVALAPEYWPANNKLRLRAATASVSFTALVYFVVLYHQDLLPRTFIDGQGLTAFKIVVEYVVCAMFAVAAVLVWLRPIKGSALRGPVLLAALLIMVASEAAFTLYAAAHDAFNLLGHLYKVAATYLIYRAVFVDAVTAPYISLHRSEEKYRDILEQAADGIIRVGPEGRVIDANRRAEAMAGMGRSTLLGQRIDGLVDSWQPTWSAAASKNSDTALWESELIRPGDENMPVEINARRLKTGEIQAIIRDITQRKLDEAQLRSAIERAEQSSRAKSQFLANMSHELRTPLNAILGFSELIQQEVYGPVGDAHYRDYATDIHNSGKHLLSIVTDLLDIARIESGTMALQDAEIDLAGLIKECVRLVEPNNAHVALSTSIPRGPLTVRADERAIRQILLNLLSNAVKFTPAGGSVDVSAQVTSEGEIAITVADTGIGIGAGDLQRVTDAFVQVETAYARKHQGVGLGLAIAKALVDLHGGRLQIESAHGKGTVASVILPAWRMAPPSLAALA